MTRLRERRKIMHLVPRQPLVMGDSARFYGQVVQDVVIRAELPDRIRALKIHFGVGARTAWHSHALGQTLHVVSGIGLVQARDGDVIVMREGDTIYTPPDEWHWHGASPDSPMTHLAIFDGMPEGPESTWAEHVTDEEYLAFRLH